MSKKNKIIASPGLLQMCEACAHCNDQFLEGKQICLGVVQYGRYCPPLKQQGVCADFWLKDRSGDKSQTTSA